MVPVLPRGHMVHTHIYTHALVCVYSLPSWYPPWASAPSVLPSRTICTWKPHSHPEHISLALPDPNPSHPPGPSLLWQSPLATSLNLNSVFLSPLFATCLLWLAIGRMRFLWLRKDTNADKHGSKCKCLSRVFAHPM